MTKYVTVQDLIDALQAVEDKSAPVAVYDYKHGVGSVIDIDWVSPYDDEQEPGEDNPLCIVINDEWVSR